jgi:(1->4)-alpha-D-glucan 1-alpha-D-glucosylmutase
MLTNLPHTDKDAIPLLAELAHNWRDGRIKLYLIWKALHFRALHAAHFSEGDFVRFEIRGKRQEHVAAFVRRYKKASVLMVVPRWLARGRYPTTSQDAERFWKDTQVRLQKTAPTSWKSILTGEEFEAEVFGSAGSLRVAKLLKNFPVALLSGTSSSRGGRKAD